jgi:hypothetical protein
MVARRPGYHGRHPCSSVLSDRSGSGPVHDARPCASVDGPACGAVIHLNETTDGRVCDSPIRPLTAALPRSADSRTAVWHGPDPECGAGGPIDPWHDLFDTTRLARTTPTDRPEHNSPRRCSGTSGPVPGGGRALDFFSQGFRRHVFVDREIGHEPFQPAILFFHLPQPSLFTPAEVGVLLFPGLEDSLADAELPAEVAYRSPTLGLPDGIEDLIFGES